MFGMELDRRGFAKFKANSSIWRRGVVLNATGKQYLTGSVAFFGGFGGFEKEG